MDHVAPLDLCETLNFTVRNHCKGVMRQVLHVDMILPMSVLRQMPKDNSQQKQRELARFYY